MVLVEKKGKRPIQVGESGGDVGVVGGNLVI